MPWIFDVREPCSNTYIPVSSLWKSKFKDLLFLQRNDDGSHTSYDQSFNWKSTSWSLLTKARAAFLTVRLFCSMLLWNGIIDHSIWTDLATGICSILQVRVCQTLSTFYVLRVLTPFTVKGICVITLCSVYVQTIRALDTLFKFINNELLVKLTFKLILEIVLLYRFPYDTNILMSYNNGQNSNNK